MSEGDIQRIVGYLPTLATGVEYTVAIGLAALALASMIGIGVAITARSSRRVPRGLARGYVHVARGLPELVQVYIWYYILPVAGLVLDAIPAGIIALGVAYGPYLGEVFRAGVEAVDRSQWEAGYVLGMTRPVVWRRIVLPQATRLVLPVLTGYFISMFKSTSLLSFITVPELFSVAQELASRNFRYFELFALVLAIYLLLGYAMITALRSLEGRGRIDRPRLGRAMPLPLELGESI